MQNEIEMMIKKVNLCPIVKLLDWISEDELAYYYRNSHIYVSLSRSDSTSVSLLEAMASGCFPIVSDIPANREWIEDGVNGFLIPLDDTNKLSEKIIVSFIDKRLINSAVSKNLDIIKQRALWNENIKELESIYYSLVNGRNNE